MQQQLPYAAALLQGYSGATDAAAAGAAAAVVVAAAAAAAALYDCGLDMHPTVAIGAATAAARAAAAAAAGGCCRRAAAPHAEDAADLRVHTPGS